MLKQMIAAIAVGALAAPLAAEPPKRDRDRYERYDHRNHDRDHHYDRGRDGRRGAYGIPPGHLPPRGMCRVWYDGRPPGHQPSATSCRAAERQAWRHGGRVIYGG